MPLPSDMSMRVVASATLLLLVPMAISGCSPAEPAKTSGIKSAQKGTELNSDESQIRAVFSHYAKALQEKDGDAAVACLDKRTLDWYESLRQDALKLTRSELAKQNLHRRLALLLMRHEFDRATLEKSTGAQLLAAGIRKGWLRDAADVQTQLSYIGSNKQSAFAHTNRSGDTPALFFEKEADGWKVNLTRTHETAQITLNHFWDKAKRSDQTEEEFLQERLKEFSKREVSARIFEGPLDKLP